MVDVLNARKPQTMILAPVKVAGLALASACARRPIFSNVCSGWYTVPFRAYLRGSGTLSRSEHPSQYHA